MRAIIHIDQQVNDQFDMADLYMKVIGSLTETAKGVNIPPNTFFMMATAISLKFMDQEFKYKSREEFIQHLGTYVLKYWEHRQV